MTGPNDPEDLPQDRPATAGDAASRRNRPSGRGQNDLPDNLTDNDQTGSAFIRNSSGAIDWNASIQDFLGNLMNYVNLFITAITNPPEYERMAIAMGIKKIASTEPPRSTHGDRNVAPATPETAPPAASAPVTPATETTVETTVEIKSEEPAAAAPPSDPAKPEDKKQQKPDRDDDFDLFDPYKDPYKIDEAKYAHLRPAADDVFEQSPALAAASLKFNDHFAAAVAGPSEASVSPEPVFAPGLGRVA